jgi:alpha-glucosidase (family GH31 glycosyl hydrolase)
MWIRSYRNSNVVFYYFSRHLFPDPKSFLSWLSSRGLRVTMNLHPASGVQPYEERYPEMVSPSFFHLIISQKRVSLL